MLIRTKVLLTVIVSLAGALAITLFLVDRPYRGSLRLVAEDSLRSASESFDTLEKNDIRMLS